MSRIGSRFLFRSSTTATLCSLMRSLMRTTVLSTFTVVASITTARHAFVSFTAVRSMSCGTLFHVIDVSDERTEALRSPGDPGRINSHPELSAGDVKQGEGPTARLLLRHAFAGSVFLARGRYPRKRQHDSCWH